MKHEIEQVRSELECEKSFSKDNGNWLRCLHIHHHESVQAEHQGPSNQLNIELEEKFLRNLHMLKIGNGAMKRAMKPWPCW
jgi:transcriptional regulator of acetoin/glycerol metabolism